MTAYRSAPPSSTEQRLILCAACGARITFAAADHECACPRCKLQQPTSRADAGWTIESLELISHDERPYDELKDFCAELGLAAQALSVKVDVDGVRCEVSLSLNSGTANGVELQAFARGFPPMRLTREGFAEAQAKAAGLSREVQTGDAAFDGEVYIDAPVVDADVLAVFSSPAVRSATRALLRVYALITIDDTSLSLSGNGDTPACYRPEAIREQLAALRVLAGAPRRTVVELTARSPAATAMVAASWGFLPLAGVFIAFAGHLYKPLSSATFFLLGAPIGLVLWLVNASILRRVLAGRSSSHRELTLAMSMTFVAFPLLVIACLYVANGAFDRSPEKAQALTVTSAEFDSEDDDMVLVAKGGGLDLEFRVHDPKKTAKVGDPVTVWTKPGALGHPWPTRPMLVKTTSGTLEEK